MTYSNRISKLIIELHGGHIWVRSTHQQGTTVSFTLQLVNEDTRSG